MNKTIIQTQKNILLLNLFLCPPMYSMKKSIKKTVARVTQQTQRLLAVSQHNQATFITDYALSNATTSTLPSEQKVTIANTLIPGLLRDEISRHIISQKIDIYPWVNCKHFVGLSSVSKAWKNEIDTAFGTQQTIVEFLHIPPVHYAAMTNNDYEIIKLQQKGYSLLEPDMNNLCPIHYAVACGKIDAIKMLYIGSANPFTIKQLKPYIPLDKKNIPSLLYQLDHPHPVSTSILDSLENTIHDNRFKKAIEILCYSDKDFMKKVLLQLHSDDISNNMPKKTYELGLFCLQSLLEQELHIATIPTIAYAKYDRCLDRQFLNEFVRAGASPNAYNQYGFTPLHSICMSDSPNHIKILKQLLYLENINVNIQAIPDQSTPLHFAAAQGHLQTVKLLLEKGADKTLKTKDGKTALDLAKQAQKTKGKEKENATNDAILFDYQKIRELLDQ